MRELIVKNHNNKLSCNYFSLIAPAPPKPVVSEALVVPFLIKDADGVIAPFQAHRITFTRFYLSTMPETFSLIANGSCPDVCRNELIKSFSATNDTEFAFYIFKKV